MKITMICSGTELLKGGTKNTNLFFLGAALAAAGLPLSGEIAAGDDCAALSAALSAALRTSDCVVVTGGLGPTPDDITLDCVARFFGLELHVSEALSAKVESCWRRFHSGRCPKAQYRQARVPECAQVIDNAAGSASGYEISVVYGGVSRKVFLLPGPPGEFEPMAGAFLVPRLLVLGGVERHHTGVFLAAGVGESIAFAAVERALKDRPLEIACTASPEGTKIFLTGGDPAIVAAGVETARRAVGPAALPAGWTGLVPYLIARLKRAGLMLVTAESCTGGMISEALTEQPGSSEVFLGGVVAYSNRLKHLLLGVPEDLLAGHGAVSAPVAAAMAEGACKKLGGDCSAAVTGIAGPGGGSAEKPVGLVYIAASGGGTTLVRELRLHGSRRMIRERARAKALLLLLEVIGNAGENKAALC